MGAKSSPANSGVSYPRKGDYGVVANPGFVGWVIRLFEKAWAGEHPSIQRIRAAHFSHAFIVVDDFGKIVEAEAKGARYSSVDEYDGCSVLYSTTPLTEAQREWIAAVARSLVGIRYGFLDIVYLGLEILGVRPRWLLGRVLSEKRMICSQLVAYCGFEAGATAWLCGQDDAQLVIPAMLAELAAEGAGMAARATILRRAAGEARDAA